MRRYVVAWMLIVVMSLQAAPVPAGAEEDEYTDALAHAMALYYEARFQESIELLLRLNEALEPQPGRLREKTGVKLHLAVAYVGLNEPLQARSYFNELYALDGDYVLDAQQFSPKVITLAEEAQAEQREIRIRNACDDVIAQLAEGNPGPVLAEIPKLKSNCPDLTEAAANAAETVYRRGVETYRRGDLPGALQQLRVALQLHPDHDLALQYSELIQGRLRFAAERTELDHRRTELDQNRMRLNVQQTWIAWTRKFEARDYEGAAEDYRRLAALDLDEDIIPMLDHMRAQYRKVLGEWIESWNEACANRDLATMDLLRRRAVKLLPEPSIAVDMLAQMNHCARKECVWMDAPLALVRLKTRVDPELPPAVLNTVRHAPVTVTTGIRIDEAGAVEVGEIQGGPEILKDAVRKAVGRWMFLPARIGDEARCVDTEIPIVIKADTAPRF